ncbi:MAG: Fe-S cluster assembly protein SufB, partial [Chloroflexi bacterium]|nr:Fe-S cluster assembly protein SufB [Chloroflexota bacterium]
MTTTNQVVRDIATQQYKYGWVTDIESEIAPPGLNEDVIRFISAKKNEPEFMLEWRLKAFRHFMSLLKEDQLPRWAHIHYPPIDFQSISYYAAPKPKETLESLGEVDPELLRTYERLGIPLQEQKRLAGVAVDAVFDSVSIATTFKEELAKKGIIFCSMSEAIQNHPDLVWKYLGSVVPYTD